MADPLIHANELSVSRGGRRVLHDIALDVGRGEVLAILGPNGSGKSTLLRALAGLIPYEGRVEVGGHEVATLPPRERAKTLAFVPQRSLLDSGLEVTEVVAQGRYAHGGGLGRLSRRDEERVTRALEAARALDLRARRFTQLSVGEQQRVLIARALATDADILLLDEPTAALDVREALATFGLLRRLADRDRAIVCVVHALGDARRFTDASLLLENGRVVERGSSASVVSPGPIRRVYGVRLEEDAEIRFEEEE